MELPRMVLSVVAALLTKTPKESLLAIKLAAPDVTPPIWLDWPPLNNTTPPAALGNARLLVVVQTDGVALDEVAEDPGVDGTRHSCRCRR